MCRQPTSPSCRSNFPDFSRTRKSKYCTHQKRTKVQGNLFIRETLLKCFERTVRIGMFSPALRIALASFLPSTTTTLCGSGSSTYWLKSHQRSWIGNQKTNKGRKQTHPRSDGYAIDSATCGRGPGSVSPIFKLRNQTCLFDSASVFDILHMQVGMRSKKRHWHGAARNVGAKRYVEA